MGKVPGAASVSTITDVRDVNLMPNIDVVTPVNSAPTDRLALGVGWVRPGLGSIGSTANPAISHWACSGAPVLCPVCFEGNEE